MVQLTIYKNVFYFQQEKNIDMFKEIEVEVQHKKVYRKDSYFSDEEELVD